MSGQGSTDDILRCIDIVLLSNKDTANMHSIYQVLGLDNFARLITLLGGKTIAFPSSKKVEEALRLATCFYFHEVEHLSWTKVCKVVPFKFSSAKMDRAIKALKLDIKQRLFKVFDRQ